MNENVMLELGYIENGRIVSVVTNDPRKLGETLHRCASIHGVPFNGKYTNMYDVGIIYFKIFERDNPESINELIFL